MSSTSAAPLHLGAVLILPSACGFGQDAAPRANDPDRSEAEPPGCATSHVGMGHGPWHSPIAQACLGRRFLQLFLASSAAAVQSVKTPAGTLTRTGQLFLEAGSWFYSSTLLET